MSRARDRARPALLKFPEKWLYLPPLLYSIRNTEIISSGFARGARVRERVNLFAIAPNEDGEIRYRGERARERDMRLMAKPEDLVLRVCIGGRKEREGERERIL